MSPSPQNKIGKKALAFLSDSLGFASASPYVHSAAHTQSANKRKDFR
jgi:hypothetical protein